MNFETAMKLEITEGIPGNAVAYMKLINNTDLIGWSEERWEKARTVYYIVVPDQKSAWLHDIYKNRCGYNLIKSKLYLEKLYFLSTKN